MKLCISWNTSSWRSAVTRVYCVMYVPYAHHNIKYYVWVCSVHFLLWSIIISSSYRWQLSVCWKKYMIPRGKLERWKICYENCSLFFQVWLNTAICRVLPTYPSLIHAWSYVDYIWKAKDVSRLEQVSVWCLPWRVIHAFYYFLKAMCHATESVAVGKIFVTSFNCNITYSLPGILQNVFVESQSRELMRVRESFPTEIYFRGQKILRVSIFIYIYRLYLNILFLVIANSMYLNYVELTCYHIMHWLRASLARKLTR